MPEKDPNTWTFVQELLFTVAFALFGGFVKFWRTRIVSREPVLWKSGRLWLEFFVELATSAFVGLLAFYACQAAELGEMWTACFVGVAGHEGARMFQLLYRVIEKRGFKI